MTIKIETLSSKEAVLKAIEEYKALGCDALLEKYNVKRIKKCVLRYNNENYDIRVIAAATYIYQFGKPLEKIISNSVSKIAIQALKNLGFDIVETPHPIEHLVKGKLYTRKELIDLYGGQLQGGIWTPTEFPVIFIFTGESGEAYGYKDGWSADGSFSYTGEGQKDDMKFIRGNKAIRDHKENGEDIFLFEDNKKDKGVRFVGMFECDTWDYIDCLDYKKDKMRKGIVFNLFPVSSAREVDHDIDTSEVAPKKETLEQLRAKAIKSSMMTGQRQQGDSKKSWFKRSEDVKKYVLQRANGICESCDQPAPFKKNNGEPYLEPHHTKRLADEGPDHPQWVGAICPTCHRRIHSGSDGMDVNKKLMAKLELKETDFK
ncbi:HNH endonuclease signature motif containing protein [Serratia sp. root2]|uniref:HNH endonuclease n=1 Tax=Serratia sp. root2 TaxID=3059676 RepID=UPI00288F9ADD|nr:HNH endonuclease signature motif containing protein [Serratia sp. root2]MDT3252273.1 HNH endonuclease signature motif containing protein [Serratia sp. root2]